MRTYILLSLAFAMIATNHLILRKGQAIMSAEYLLPKDAVILSTADLQGNILTYNKTFLMASGYEAHEIEGKPHNILRHPDMPKEAFKDLWQTISNGRPWFGFVKNKRKNGDYYWVAANVSPIYTNDRITGYVSVRYPASAEQKTIGESLYAKVNARTAPMRWTPYKRYDAMLVSSIGLGLASLLVNLTLGNSGLLLSWLLGTSALALSVFRGLQLAKPSAGQIKAVQDLSNGKFHAPIAGHDDWSNALNLLRTRIGQHASDTKDAMLSSATLTKAMSEAADEISGAMSSQAATSTQMSSSIAEITSTMEEFSASSSQIAEHSKMVVDVANQSLSSAYKGSEAMQQVLSRMDDINTDNHASMQEIIALGTKSKEISKIMTLINNLADQTKLIAFNAALEASSAGEAGKRFSVVASEIRRLADSTTESTQEIESKIHEIQDAISRLIITSEKGANGIVAGTTASNETATRFNDIVASVNQTSTAAQQISLSTLQQKTASSQVVVALREIASASAQTANALNRIHQISEEMSHLADGKLFNTSEQND